MCSYLLVALCFGVAAAVELQSPCPKRFEYGAIGETQWEGTLNILSEYKLHGMWVRVFFDKPLKELKILNDVAEVKVLTDDPKQFLIKSRETVLKKNEPLRVKIAAVYGASDAPPTLIGYRLNARDVCPQDQD